MEKLTGPSPNPTSDPRHTIPRIQRGEQAQKVLNAAIIGGGKACYNLIQLLVEDRLGGLRIKILGVSDLNPEAPGFRYAKTLNLKTTTDFRELFHIENLNLIIELTGSPAVRDQLYGTRPPEVSVVDHRAAALLWDLIQKEVEKGELEKDRLKYQEENIRNLYDLSLEKSRLKTIINCMANGVMVTNRDQEIVLHNPAFLRLMDLPEETGTPVPLADIHADPSLTRTMAEILERGYTENEFISQEIQAGGRTLRAISAPAMGIDRNVFLCVAGTVTVLEDITAFKQLDKMKSDFVNLVVHELRSPLVSLRQINSVLLEGLAGKLEEKQQDLVQKGVGKIDTLLALINDLLDVAKLEEAKYIRHEVPTDIRRIAEEIVTLMEPRARDRGIVLSAAFENLKLIQADPRNIEEIFNNLISNAINYSPEGGRVTVTVRGVGDFVEIRVEDTGVGIPAEELPKIFDRFYRVKHPKTRKVTGTGLGLAIVKGIVEAQRGAIDVESYPEKGTTFKILLPFSPKKA